MEESYYFRTTENFVYAHNWALKSALKSAYLEVFSSLSDPEESSFFKLSSSGRSPLFCGIQKWFSSTIAMTTGVLAYC